MDGQYRLVLMLLLTLGATHMAFTSTPRPANDVHDLHDDILDNTLDTSNELPLPEEHKSGGVKISTPKVKEVPSVPSTTTSAKKASSATQKSVSDEILKDLIEASKHSVALADDPRFNKMLPEKFKTENATSTNKSEENYDIYDNYDEYDDYDYDEDSTNSEALKITKESSLGTAKKVEMKPIKEDDKLASKSKDTSKTKNDIDDMDDDDDDYDSDEEDDDDDDLGDEEEVVFSENVPCPRYCVCARNINSYLVATCSRFDPETQKFGTDITDLIVTDVGPKYPILLGPEFFLQMGLKHVSSIKISNCTIEFLHPAAFHGLDELYSVNLTNVGLAVINPDTFSSNKKLRLLTISGNDLSVMSGVHYLLNSSSIEELDLSRNNLIELNPSAFSQLSNIVYINLSQNNLQKIPERLFDSVETIEELDLSYNSLTTLPPTIFNRTALAILRLKYNSITDDLRFGTEDLQQLDLSFNNIKQIHHGMFDKMTGLTNLNLKGNGITKIQPDSFLTMKSLRHIDLSINELDQLSSMVFYKNSDLDVIRLNDNPRLSQLPTDGFLSYNGYFTVYFMDISNCAIGALGHKTFSTMPHLATLKLAWNNINNLERDTFSSLTKLIDLDLSNNLITRLDELTFMQNNELTKLNLAGNPMRKLSVRLFLPLSKLRELDVSDCELASLLADNQYGVGRKYKFYDTLRSFNASANQIKNISSKDVRNFKNLRTLDIAHNPLKCNEDFQDFISYVSLNTNMVTSHVPTLANLEAAAAFTEFQPQAGWAELAHQVCKHHESEMPKQKEGKLEKRIEIVDKELDEDAKNLLNLGEKNKMKAALKDSQKSHEIVDDHLEEKLEEGDDAEEEDDINNAEEDKDSEEEENESEYDDEDDDENDDEEEEDENSDDKADDDDYDTFDTKKAEKVNIHELGLKVEEINLKKEDIDKALLDKFLLNDDESSENDAEEEIIIQRGRIYYDGYEFLIPVIVIVTTVLVLMLLIAKIVSIVMRKRGERYRMALLASNKNSIVYQKLTEEINAPVKEPKQPKVHRYTPINQV